MAYSQTVVLAGGIAHVPILIMMFKFIEKKFTDRYKSIRGA